MWLNEGVLAFIEDLQSSTCLWDMHCADYKHRKKKKVMRLTFLQKNTKSAISKLKKSPISNVSSGGSTKKLWHPRRLGLPEETNFVCLRGWNCFAILCIFLLDYGDDFLEQNLEALLVILTKFLNPEPSCIFNSRRRVCPC
jgi:hypothetical protein